MTFEFFVPGPLPGLNEIIGEARKNRFAGAKQKKLWTEKIHWIIKAAKIPPIESARFHFEWHEKNKLRNPDNVAAAKKFVFDSLQSAGVLKNDGWSQVLGFTDSFFVSPEKPGVRVIISPV
jgi:hypothetical protein